MSREPASPFIDPSIRAAREKEQERHQQFLPCPVCGQSCRAEVALKHMEADGLPQRPWMPIETAPQDGSQFLATGGGLALSVEIVSYNERVGCWDAMTCTLDDRDNEAEGYSRPLWWMPLPSSAPTVTRPVHQRETK